jgi:hypothetical protein
VERWGSRLALPYEGRNLLRVNHSLKNSWPILTELDCSIEETLDKNEDFVRPCLISACYCTLFLITNLSYKSTCDTFILERI